MLFKLTFYFCHNYILMLYPDYEPEAELGRSLQQFQGQVS